ncbi:MAG: hypothetical protein IH885_07110, partial [Myxococcales bacterium]|nr:hypothetical protein [Myxococcales bacterium]
MANAKSLIVLITLSLGISIIAAGAPPVAVPTFHSLGITWSPAEGAQSIACTARYRVTSTATWRLAQPLWFDAGSSEYRGSIVHLEPDTTYDIELSLQGLAVDTAFVVSTWNDEFPVAQTIELPAYSSSPLLANQSGSPTGYVVYTGPAGG